MFEQLDLDLQRGCFYALLGKSGSGKSTLMRILAHRESVLQGHGLVLGVDFGHDFGAVREEIAFVTDERDLPPELKVGEALALSAGRHPGWNELEAQRLLKEFNFDLLESVGTLTRAELVELALLLELPHAPTLILLDEVVSALTEDERKFVLAELTARVRNGATVVLATNEHAEVADVATAFVLLGDHHVQLNAPTMAIAHEYRKLVRRDGEEHVVFQLNCCVEVGISALGEPLYVISVEDARRQGLPAELFVDAPISPAEMLEYLACRREPPPVPVWR